MRVKYAKSIILKNNKICSIRNATGDDAQEVLNMGFVEFGRNPRGIISRYRGWQELILMRLELD